MNSEITRAEAERLVLAVPEATGAKKAGHHLNVQFWKPIEGDTQRFYFLELDQKETKGTPLGNGMIAHLAVNRRSGEVISVYDFQSQSGPKLAAAQRSIRRQHCISAETVKEEAARDLFLPHK